ncbi:MAG: hypothetical protein IJI14_13745 [Anaerolineaceae bacterium]|nr:hypothetical protein [Anaerolineaceae bacterium]
MHIFTQGTVSMWIENHKDGMHVVSEIDDDEMGFKNEVHYIIPPEAVKSLYSIISEKEFIDLCRKEWSSGMEDFLIAHGIPYSRVPVK